MPPIVSAPGGATQTVYIPAARPPPPDIRPQAAPDHRRLSRQAAQALEGRLKDQGAGLADDERARARGHGDGFSQRPRARIELALFEREPWVEIDRDEARAVGHRP